MTEPKTEQLVNVDELDPKEYILVKGAQEHNLKNIDVAIPRNKLTVITGVSGSGKSSLAFDTLFAEGQRMYVESLSSYARQFLGRMEKPEVEYIKGLCPAIAVEQKVNTSNRRSTVGTSTEIYDYLRLLFARIGITYSPVSGKPVKKDTISSIVDYILSKEEGSRFMIVAEFNRLEGRPFTDTLNLLLQHGYSRLYIAGETHMMEDLIEDKELLNSYENRLADFRVVIDRAAVKKDDEELQFRLGDSVQTAFFEGHGSCEIIFLPRGEDPIVKVYNDRFEADGMLFEEPSVKFFSFTNPYGACRTCDGFGTVLGIDEDLVIPDKSRSIYDDAVAPWRSAAQKDRFLKPLLRHAPVDLPLHKPYYDLSDEQKAILWNGAPGFRGIWAFFEEIQSQTHKIQYRVMLSRYRGRTVCKDCRGTRLRKDASYVKIQEKSIQDIVLMPLHEATAFFDTIRLTEREQKIAQRILAELQNRLGYLMQVGLGYLTLNRLSSTLSGGEFQRIQLATSLGSALVGSMYVLDEPSIGLHPRDTLNLIGVVKHLRDLGNTVIVVEHEEEVIRAADYLIDIGPDAGVHGGSVIFQGKSDDVLDTPESYTAQYLTGQDTVPVPSSRRAWNKSIRIEGATENNLKHIDAEFPLQVLTVVTGVSGSGKSTLVKKVLLPAIGKYLSVFTGESGKFDKLSGDLKAISGIEFVDQNPIGKSSRSNPVTYVKAYDFIRNMLSQQPLSKQRGYTPAHFSFNVDGGRCEECLGEGETKVEMQFMADIYLTCETCHGHRFKAEILEVTYKEKNAYEILEMTVDEGMEFFADHPPIAKKLKPLQDVGLGYITLGQSSNTLSGGEAQRVKLAYFLGRGQLKQEAGTWFIFDEPTTGLHFHDISKLLTSINALVEAGHTVTIIEHNLEIIKSADWIIDLGPEGGEEGGQITFAGKPEDMINLKDNHTAKFLKEKLG